MFPAFCSLVCCLSLEDWVFAGFSHGIGPCSFELSLRTAAAGASLLSSRFFSCFSLQHLSSASASASALLHTFCSRRPPSTVSAQNSCQKMMLFARNTVKKSILTTDLGPILRFACGTVFSRSWSGVMVPGKCRALTHAVGKRRRRRSSQLPAPPARRTLRLLLYVRPQCLTFALSTLP